MSSAASPTTRPLEVEIQPPWPYRLIARGRGDSVLRKKGGTVYRLLHVLGHSLLVQAFQRRDGAVVVRAQPAAGEGESVPFEVLELGVARFRFSLGVDDDLRSFLDEFRRHPLLGPAIRRRPWLRPSRRPWPWESLAWAVTEQLIEVERAQAIQRRFVYRYGAEVEVSGVGKLRDVPTPRVMAARAPAELQAADLSAARSIALVKIAREIERGHIDPGRAEHDERLLAISEIGPWTVEKLGLHGRGDPDALPAGDLAYVKYVGHARGEGYRATVPQIHEYFAEYEPFRALAGLFLLVDRKRILTPGPPLRMLPQAA